MSLPVLSEHRNLRFTTVTALYFAQGIQLGLMNVAIPAYLAANGVSPALVGSFIGASLLPWSLKFFCAPLMDRFTYLPLGRRRPWIMLGIVGAFLGYLGMSLVVDPLHNLVTLTAFAALASAFTAILDVAVDGMAIEVLPVEEQPSANGFMWGGKVIGSAVTTAGAAFLLNHWGMPGTFFMIALVVLAFGLFPILFRERPGERLFPWSVGQASVVALDLQLENWGEIFTKLWKAISLPSSLLLLLLGYLIGITYGLFDAIMPVFTIQHLKWSDTGFSNLAATAGIIGGLTGMIIGGVLIEHLGRLRSIQLFLGCYFLTVLIMGLLQSQWANDWFVDAFTIIIYTLRTLVLIALFALAMSFCWKPIGATQFAVYMAIANFGISSGAAILGPLEALLSFAQLFYALGLVTALIICLIFLLDPERHNLHLKDL
ncbi:MAG: MFS transporter [Saprospiraceae bacterium]|nr:MFS transporter [Saprospiraceae bacterium]